MWKISGNGMTKPSYMYGTMHISGKMVFHLGDPFYDAMKEVDMVALELEPEAWLQAIFEDKSRSLYTTGQSNWTSDFGFNDNDGAPDLKGHFGLNTDLQQRVKEILMFDPLLLNYLLFRYNNYGYSADYEENTWLDMHIYQSGKKMGKTTFGLETYKQSSHFMKQARKEEMSNKEKKDFDEKDRKLQEELITQIEPAYRRQDLDLIDSLNKKTTSVSFDKYILIERNKVFVTNMDSLMKSGKSLFAGMGCAHLPGSNGVIEMLREKGYTVEPYSKGERGGKQREKLEKQIFKRSYQSYTAKDKSISFSTPAAVYPVGGDDDGTVWLSLDIPNGASFIVTSLRSYAGLNNLDALAQLNSIDSVLYEAVAGSIVSNKRIAVQGYQGLDVINKSRRGDYQRSQILILPESILVMRVLAPGESIKNGYGNEFFSSLKLNIPTATNTTWLSPDKMVSMKMPGQVISYSEINDKKNDCDFTTTSYDKTTGIFCIAMRHTIENPGFIDEDSYETNRLADVYQEENTLKETSRYYTQVQNLPALRANYINAQNKPLHALFVIQDLNYFVFSAMTGDSTKANEYFKSIKFSLPVYDKYYSYSDTTCHFNVQIPYEHSSAETEEEEEYNWYFSNMDEEKSIYYGTEAQTRLSVPGSPKVIDISFQRYHRFSDGDDSLQFVKNREELIIKNDYRVDSKKVTWNKDGVVIEHLLSDTASVRKEWVKQILYNKSLYTLSASYDSILGPDDFVRTVFNTFQPTDTVFPYYHFRNMDNEYLDALCSTDSTMQVNARKLSSEIDFSAPVAPRLRSMLRNMPATDDEEQKAFIKENLTYGLQFDTTLTNINFIREEYYRNMDSAYYQVDLLRTLLHMRTKDAMLAFKQLILDEPPVLDEEVESMFYLASDSLKLARHLLPEALRLVNLNEYESAVYDITATLVDSSLITSKSIEGNLGQILLEAKNELKRLNASNEDDGGFETYTLINYCKLLQPFRSKPEVAAFFTKVYTSKKTLLLLDLARFDLQHKVSVSDSVFIRIAAKEQRVLSLYTMAHEQKITERIPSKYNSRDVLLKLYIKENYKNKYENTATVDSVVVFHTKKDIIRGEKLEVRYCKYKRSDSKQWKGIIFMFDESDPTNLWPPFVESSRTVVLDEHEDDMFEMDLEYKKLVERNRKQRNFNSSYDEYFPYWD